jgi:NADPH:quinone reductase-like Zn-dependent oxidoreductase
MTAIVVTDQAAGTAGMKLSERPDPRAAINDVVVQIHASGFVGTELSWPSTWTDRVGPSETRPPDGLAVDFVVESDRAQLGEIVERVRDGRLRTNIGTVSTLDNAVAAFNPTERPAGKTIIRVRP